MSDAIYPKTSKGSKARKASQAPRASTPAHPVDEYEDYDEYELDEEYGEYDRPAGNVEEDWEYEEERSLITSPSRAVALGVALVALVAVFSAIIWMLSTNSTPGPPQIVDGAAGGVPVITGFAQTSEAEAPVKGAFAPNFSWTDSNNQNVSLASFRGSKPVFVNFWGTWCPPCRQEMPLIESFYEQHKNNIQIIGVSMYPRDDPSTVLNFVKQSNYNWKFIHDGDYKVAQRYEVANVPSSYFIDKNGIIQAVQIGEIMNQSVIEGYYNQVATTK
jgi:thiol-disulfide isomerase/thioredoxin